MSSSTLPPDQADGPSIIFDPNPVAGQTVTLSLTRVGTSITLWPDPVAGRTVTPDIGRVVHTHLLLDPLQPRTDVAVSFGQNVIWLQFDPVAGSSDSLVRDFPDLSNNTPILLAFSAGMQLDPVEPVESE